MTIKPRLGPFEYLFILPAADTPVPAGRTLWFDGAVTAGGAPVAVDGLAGFLAGKAVGQPLAGRTPVLVILGDVGKRTAIEEATCLVPRGLRLREIGLDPGLLAGADLIAIVVAAVGDHLERLGAQCRLCLAGQRRELPPITAHIADLVGDDQVMAAVYRALDVVADDPAATGVHGASIGIGQ